MNASDKSDTTSSRGTAQRIAEWIAEVNQRDKADQPLRWVDGRYHTAAELAHCFNEEQDATLSSSQMGSSLAVIRDNPNQYSITVEYDDNYEKGRWQVYKGVFANVG